MLTRLLFWCWLQELICSSEDIVPLATTDNIIIDTTTTNNTITDKNNDHHAPNLMALYQTIAALHNIALQLKNENNNETTTTTTNESTQSTTTATNTKTSANGSFDRNSSSNIDHDDETIDNNRFHHNNQYNFDANALNNTINYNNSINLNTKPPMYGGYGSSTGGNNNVNGRRSATTPNSLDLSSTSTQTKRRKLARRTVSQKNGKYENFLLNGILEECEYDSDVGKFNCKIDSDNSSGSFDMIDSSGGTSSGGGGGNNDNKMLFDVVYPIKQSAVVVVVDDNNDRNQQVVSNKTGIVKNESFLKRIEFFELNTITPTTTTASVSNSSCSSIDSYLVTNNVKKQNEMNINDKNNTQLSTILCLSAFVITFVLLITFELPS